MKYNMGFLKRKKTSKKKNLNKGSKWKHFQNKIAVKSKHLEGYNVETQKKSVDGKRPDYYGEGILGQKVVGDAKNVKKLTKKHIDQVAHYARTLEAEKGFVSVKKGTEVSSEVLDYAEKKGVYISRMSHERKNNFQGFNLFAINEYGEEDVSSKNHRDDPVNFSLNLNSKKNQSEKKSSSPSLSDVIFGSSKTTGKKRTRGRSNVDKLWGTESSSNTKRRKGKSNVDKLWGSKSGSDSIW
jgi:hypothetical protein